MSAVDKFVTEIKRQEAELTESLITNRLSPEDYHRTVGRIQGLREAINTLMQQLSDE